MAHLPDPLGPRTTVLTANRRLSRVLRQEDAERRRAAGEGVWETPDILPWGAWLTRCWEGLLGPDAALLLLGPLQEQALWERVIGESGGDVLLQVTQAARLAAEAWSLVHAWRLDVTGEARLAPEEVQAFLQWADTYADRCRREGWTDGARLPDLLAERLGAHPELLPERLLLVGFEELTPQQRHLLGRLAELGCRWEEAPPAQRPAAPVRHLCADAEEEGAACARWARATLEARPDARIGVVVPDLAAQRPRLERLFEDLLHPGAVLPGAPARRAFNLSLGRPLLEQPLIHAAFLVLDLMNGPLPVERAGQLLRSPFLGDARSERGRRARLDARLRESGELRVSPERLQAQARAAADGARPWSCPQLASRLDRALKLVRGGGGSRPAGAWAELFMGLLQQLGWPGERPLDSAEYQTARAWRQLLESFASLALVQPRLGGRAALSRLRRLAGETPFQPEAEEAPIQALGLLEAGGLRFDALWVLGLHDEVWPPPARPNPFLPAPLQRRLGLPHASAERELAYAARLTERLAAAAPEVHFSSPGQEGDRVLRPSPLIASLPLEPVAAATPGYAALIHGARALVPQVSGAAAPLPPGAPAPGGARLLQLQAACPFRAFAELRLGAQPLGGPVPGLDALERGSLLHRVLEGVWRELGDQQGLQALPDEELAALLERQVAAAVAELARRRPETVTGPFRDLERERLVRLLQEWLALERARPPFDVVALEAARETALGGLAFHLRVDRVDRLADGATALIDYKTGQPRLSGWFGERPDEPQLPLYAVTGDAPVEALLFARVRSGECAFLGLSREPGRIPGVAAYGESRQAAEGAPDWSGQLDRWQSVLHDLAAAFRAGDGRVDPKQPPQTCTWCSLPPLCRIHSLAAAAAPDEGADDE